MADSKWSKQKPAAKSRIIALLADGQEKKIDILVEDLIGTGLTRKNALKALYNEVFAGTVAMTGTWSDGAFKKVGA